MSDVVIEQKQSKLMPFVVIDVCRCGEEVCDRLSSGDARNTADSAE